MGVHILPFITFGWYHKHDTLSYIVLISFLVNIIFFTIDYYIFADIIFYSHMIKMVFSNHRSNAYDSLLVKRNVIPQNNSVKISLVDFRYNMIERIQYNGGCSSCSRK